MTRIGRTGAAALAVVGVVALVLGGRALGDEQSGADAGARAGVGAGSDSGSRGGSGSGGEAGASTPPPVGGPAAPGWRWESYGTVKVQVPDNWADTTYAHTWSCGDSFLPDGMSRAPRVGRPWRGPVRTIMCQPVPQLAERVPHLWFDDFDAKPGITRFDHGWVSEVRVVAGVPLTVFSNDAALRQRILDSAERTGSTDPNGCSVARPAVLGDNQRPAGPGLAAIGAVKSIRVCVYSYELPGEPSVFQAGLQISGDTARQLGDALRAAPDGVGPTMSSSNCGQPQSRDDLLLTVDGENGEQVVVVRYAACRSNGTDDGTTLRRLTKDTLLPLSKVLYKEFPVLPIMRDLAR